MSTIVREDSGAPLDFETPAAASPATSAIKWGIILAVANFLLLIIGYNLGWHDPRNGFVGTAVQSILGFAIPIGLTIFGMREYRRDVNGGFMTFGQGATWTAIYAAVAAVLGALLSYVFYEFIAPDYFETVIEGMAATFEDAGFSQSDLDEMTAAMAESNNVSSQLITNTIGGFFVYLVIGLVCAAILKRNPAGV